MMRTPKRIPQSCVPSATRGESMMLSMFSGALAKARPPRKPTAVYRSVDVIVEVQKTRLTLTPWAFSFSQLGTVTQKAKLKMTTPIASTQCSPTHGTWPALRPEV